MDRRFELVDLIKEKCNDSYYRESLINAVEDYTEEEVEKGIQLLKENKFPYW